MTDLSGRKVNGIAVIMVPVPALKEGKFFIPPAQEGVYFGQKLTCKVL